MGQVEIFDLFPIELCNNKTGLPYAYHLLIYSDIMFMFVVGFLFILELSLLIQHHNVCHFSPTMSLYVEICEFLQAKRQERQHMCDSKEFPCSRVCS